MPVVKKSKKGKKIRRPKGNRVASAPTRDVIINISTAKPRASKTLKPAVPKRSEDLGGRIKDFEVSQSQFRQTQMIKEQAVKMGLIDKRLSVLTDVVDNERTNPLVQKGGGTPQTPKGEEKPPPEAEQEEKPPPEAEQEEKQERIDVAMGKQRGRPKLTEEQKQANKEKREIARRESLTTPVVATAVSPVEAEMTGKKEPAGAGGGGQPRADLVGAVPLPKGRGSNIPFADVEGVDRGAEEKPPIDKKKKKLNRVGTLNDPNQSTLEGMFEVVPERK